MIVKEKFKAPAEYPEQEHIKKTYDYYKESGNLWNSKYLSSDKIARYYLNQQTLFLSGPSSPENISLQESFKKSQDFMRKTEANRQKSRDLLNKRKNERINLSTAQSSISYKKEAFNTTGTFNNWDNIREIPVSKLKHVIPAKVIEKDKDGIQNIIRKSVELDKQEEWILAQQQKKMLKCRISLIKRHNEKNNLERRSGVQKIRDPEISQNKYGYNKSYIINKKTEDLSKPKKKPSDVDFLHKDFRGLLHADYSEVLKKIPFNSSKKNRPKSSLSKFKFRIQNSGFQ